jgi:hypothetical protein
LDLDGFIAIVDRNHFEQFVGYPAVPFAYDWLHRVEPPSSAILIAIQLPKIFPCNE